MCRSSKRKDATRDRQILFSSYHFHEKEERDKRAISSRSGITSLLTTSHDDTSITDSISPHQKKSGFWLVEHTHTQDRKKEIYVILC